MFGNIPAVMQSVLWLISLPAWLSTLSCAQTPKATSGKDTNEKTRIQKSADQKYDLLDGVNCTIKAKSYAQDAYGNISADAVQLVCDGQDIKLVDGKLTNNWLATVNFGKFMVKQLVVAIRR